MKKIILLDIDNTVLDFSKAFEGWMESNGFTPVVTNKTFTEVYYIEDYWGLPIGSRDKLVGDFFNSPAFANMEPIEGAVQALQRLTEAGYSFVAVTACLHNEVTQVGRTANLKHHFGDNWLAVHITGLSGDKTQILRSYRPSFYVEDGIAQAYQGMAYGHNVVILTNDYNRNSIDDFVRYDDWNGIADYILGNEGQ